MLFLPKLQNWECFFDKDSSIDCLPLLTFSINSFNFLSPFFFPFFIFADGRLIIQVQPQASCLSFGTCLVSEDVLPWSSMYTNIK